MEYYIVRIYRREAAQAADGDLRENRLTGQLEDDNGHKETFHDAEGLWQLLLEEMKVVQTNRPGNKG